MNKRHVVTGGFGFIGSHLVEALVKRKEEVLIIDNLFSSRKNDKILQLPKVSFEQIDITDMNALDKVLKKGDIIYHLAAHFGHPRSLQDPLLNYKVNIGGTLNLLELCRKKDFERLVFASTFTVYGDPIQLPIDEEHPTNPKSLYDVSKLSCEKYVLNYHKLYGLKTSILRFANVYGPRDPHGPYRSAVSNFIYQVMNNQQPTLQFEGKSTRDFIHVSDLVQALLLASSNQKAIGQIFNVCTGIETAIHDLVELIINYCGSAIKPQLVPSRNYYALRLVGSNKRLSSLLGFQQKILLKDGLRDTVAWCKSNVKEFSEPQPYSYL